MSPALSLPVSKYHGLGNHFVIVDNREGLYDFSDSKLVRKICCRKTGIGADCLLELVNCCHDNHQSCAFEVVNYHPSGSRAKLCGNGSRCVAEFARRLGMVTAESVFYFCGHDGEHWGRHLVETGLTEIGLCDVTNIREYHSGSYFIFTGSPTHVEFVQNVWDIDVQKLGQNIRFDSRRYPDDGTNVMFVHHNERAITMRSYERGVNDETWSCGTGTTGVALVTDFRTQTFNGREKTFVKEINSRIGKLFVKATRVGEMSYTNISLIGPVSHVFDGTYFQDSFFYDS